MYVVARRVANAFRRLSNMPAINRLSHAEITLVLKQKKHHINGEFFRLIVGVLPASNTPKIACVVSRKISTKAVVRNRIKRHCRETVCPILDTIMPTAVILFYAKKESCNASFDDIKNDVKMLLGKIIVPFLRMD